MSRKVLLMSNALAIALLLILASLLTLAQAMPAVPATTNLSPSANKVVQGHALTDDDPPQPVQNARIVAKKLIGGDVLAETLTDESGAYTLTLPTGVNSCRVYAETTDTTIPANAVEPDLPVLVGPQTETADFIFTIASAQIRGRLLISGTLPAPPPFAVTVTARSRTIINPVQVSQQIDPDGAFTLTVPPDTFDVFAIPENFCYFPTDLALGIVVTGAHDLGDVYLSSIGDVAMLNGHVRTPKGQAATGVDVMAVKLDLTDPSSFLPLPPATTDGDGAFSFCIPSFYAPEGTWWLGVALGRTNDYMPYRLAWQTTVSISATQIVTDIELLVEPATALISGTLIAEQTGQPATDACGVIAAFKQGEPAVYNSRPFVGGTFELPVVTGTFRLAVIPDPGLGTSLPLYPEECVASAGKYLVKTIPSVPVTQPLTITLPITVRVADATIHGRLWDVTEQTTVTGVSGQILGWSEGNWSFTRVQTDTGVGNLRASSGDNWLLAYRIDPQSVYRELPGVALAQVPTETTDWTVNLPLWESTALITGTVFDPSGSPVTAPVAVAAIGLSPHPSVSREGVGVKVKPRGDTMVTSDGQFTLTLGYGAYLVTVFGPPELRAENAWISPEPQLATLTPADPVQGLELQFRLGDATLHGHLELASTSQVAGVEERIKPPALVWAATAGGHTKMWVDMTENGEYSLPLLQGKRWAVGAAYEVGTSLWITQTVITVSEGATDILLDLTLTPAYSLAAWLVQSIDSSLPFYGELEDGTFIEIPVGALPQGQLTLYLQNSIVSALAQADFAQNPGQNPTRVGALALASEQPPEGTILQSPAYEVTVVDDMGHVLTGDELNTPLMLSIPYDESALAMYGLSEDDIQAVYFGQEGVGWEAVANYVVDGDEDEVVIFADRLGTYALIATVKARHEIFLPLVLREVSSG